MVIHKTSVPGRFQIIAADGASSTYHGLGHLCAKEFEAKDTAGGYTWYPCVTPTNVHPRQNLITCAARAPKRWVTVLP